MRPESSSHLPGKESPLFVIKIFRFQPPGLCSHHFFYIKYPLTLHLAKGYLSQKQKNPKTSKNCPLPAGNNVFLPPPHPFALGQHSALPPLGLSLSCFCFQVLITLECYHPSLCLFPNPQDRVLQGQVTSRSHQHHPAQGLDSRELRK